MRPWHPFPPDSQSRSGLSSISSLHSVAGTGTTRQVIVRLVLPIKPLSLHFRLHIVAMKTPELSDTPWPMPGTIG